MNRIKAWWLCRRECGVSDCAVYSCQRVRCPGRMFNLGWREGYVMGDRDAVNHVATGERAS